MPRSLIRQLLFERSQDLAENMVASADRAGVKIRLPPLCGLVVGHCACVLDAFVPLSATRNVVAIRRARAAPCSFHRLVPPWL